jgi:hypothetical protein
MTLTRGEYEGVRADATQFAVVPEHEILDIEKVVWADRPVLDGAEASRGGHSAGNRPSLLAPEASSLRTSSPKRLA